MYLCTTTYKCTCKGILPRSNMAVLMCVTNQVLNLIAFVFSLLCSLRLFSPRVVSNVTGEILKHHFPKKSLKTPKG